MVVYYTLRIDIMTLYAYFQGLFLLEEEDIPLMSRRNFVTDKFFFLPLQMQNHSIVSGAPGPDGHPVVSLVVGAERRVEKGALPRLPVGTGHPVVSRMPNRPFYAHELRNAQ